jgi:hypothetical protein
VGFPGCERFVLLGKVESYLVSIQARLGVKSKTELIPPRFGVRDLARVPYFYGGITSVRVVRSSADADRGSLDE